MSLKNVVQVMNFHSLLRVDKSRKEAKKFTAIENMVLDMLDNVLNNRNIQQDFRAIQMDPSQPELVILLGSDLGFCGNLNNLVRRTSREQPKEDYNVIIGRKLCFLKNDHTLLYQKRDEFQKDHSALIRLLDEGMRQKKFSAVRLIYNHYKNASQVDFVNKVIFPLPKESVGTGKYTEDFVAEGDLQQLVVDLASLYLEFELEIASQVSVAAENINRQNITTESLKKIDERDAEAQQKARRVMKDMEFAKVLENFTRLRRF